MNGRRAFLGACALLLAGCGENSNLVVPVTHGTLETTFRVGVSGAGTRFVGDISLEANVGTVELGGRRLPALAYSAVFDPRSYDTYNLLVVAPERWYIVPLYCQAGQLLTAWFESTAGASLEYEDATGRCDELPTTATKVVVDLPATIMSVPPPLRGFQVVGPTVSIPEGQPGWVVFGPTTYDLYAFLAVDCTTCGDPGWLELHAVFRDGATYRTGFGIFYLFASPNSVLVQHALTLPDLGRPVGDGLYLDGAAWSAL